LDNFLIKKKKKKMKNFFYFLIIFFLILIGFFNCDLYIYYFYSTILKKNSIITKVSFDNAKTPIHQELFRYEKEITSFSAHNYYKGYFLKIKKKI
jgi:hypothetical protein